MKDIMYIRGFHLNIIKTATQNRPYNAVPIAIKEQILLSVKMEEKGDYEAKGE